MQGHPCTAFPQSLPFCVAYPCAHCVCDHDTIIVYLLKGLVYVAGSLVMRNLICSSSGAARAFLLFRWCLKLYCKDSVPKRSSLYLFTPCIYGSQPRKLLMDVLAPLLPLPRVSRPTRQRRRRCHRRVGAFRDRCTRDDIREGCLSHERSIGAEARRCDLPVRDAQCWSGPAAGEGGRGGSSSR